MPTIIKPKIISNIVQQQIVPNKPKILANEQIYVYVPRASTESPGIASFNDKDFLSFDGHISLSWPMKTQIEEISNPLNEISRVKLLSDEFEQTGNESEITNPLTEIKYISDTAEVKLKRTNRNAFLRPELIMLDNSSDFEKSTTPEGYSKYTLKRNNPLVQPALVKLDNEDFNRKENETIDIRWPYAHNASGTNRTDGYGLIKINPTSKLFFTGSNLLDVDLSSKLNKDFTTLDEKTTVSLTDIIPIQTDNKTYRTNLAALKEGIVQDLVKLKFEIVDELPNTGETNIIYLLPEYTTKIEVLTYEDLPTIGEEEIRYLVLDTNKYYIWNNKYVEYTNIYKEYIWLDELNKYEQLGTSDIELYANKVAYDKGISNLLALNVQDAIDELADIKVDKVEGSTLITSDELSKLAGIDTEAQVNIIEVIKVDNTPLTINEDKEINIDLSGKVDKVEGSTLITSDELSKLSGIDTGAQVNIIEVIKVDNTSLTINEDKEINIDLSGKVDKTTIGDKRRVYGVDASNNQELIEFDIIPTKNSNKILDSSSVYNSLTTKEPLLPGAPEEPEDMFLGLDGTGNKIWKKVTAGISSSSGSIYLSNEDSDVDGYKMLSNSLDETETVFEKTANNDEKLIATFLYDKPIGVDIIDAGTWHMHLFCKVSDAANVTRFKLVPFAYHEDETETDLFAEPVLSQDINNTSYAFVEADYMSEAVEVLPTDRIGVRISMMTNRTSPTTASFKVGNGYASFVALPLALRHDETRGKNDNPNYQHISSSEKTNLNNAVLFTEQTLTTEQQEQARANIGVESGGDINMDDIIDGETYVKTENNLSDTLKSNYDTAYTNTHTHSNKTILDNTTASYTTAEQTKLGAISGTNTGDETESTIKTKLGITTLSGSNTGDQDISEKVDKIYSTDYAYTDGLVFTWDTDHYIVGTGSTTVMRNAYPVGTATEIVIPKYYDDGTHGTASVTEIGVYSFRTYTGLVKIIIPDSITRIHSESFFGCSGLTYIIIPNSVIQIDNHVFLGCTSLKSITIPDYVTQGGSSGFEFSHCINLIDVKLPNNDSFYSGRDNMFYSCSNLTTITIPKNVEYMPSMFNGCSNLTKVYIKALTPPFLDSTFTNSGITASTGAIYVPYESLTAYKTATGWSTYANRIYPIPDGKDLTEKENVINKVTSISSSSTDTEYPTAKCMYDIIGNIETLLAEV